MNLTRRTLLGLLKYPSLLSHTRAEQVPADVRDFRHLRAKDWHPAKGIYNDDHRRFDWVLELLDKHDRQLFGQMRNQNYHPTENRKTRFKSLDCSIMELADDIAYGVHDLEDAIVMGLVTREQWQEAAASHIAECGEQWLENSIGEISDKLFGSHHQRKDAIGALVNALLASVYIDTTTGSGEDKFDAPLLRWNARLSPEMDVVLLTLKRFVSRFVIGQPDIQLHEYKGQQLVMELFDAFASDPERLLPDENRTQWLKAMEDGDNAHRVISDYISSMTDGFALRLYSTMFLPTTESGIGYRGGR